LPPELARLWPWRTRRTLLVGFMELATRLER
jgi:hypothetical protein